ncbi:hypothetical protein K503DRAFT_870757 [Rhizopogon vinicolor AM-OR11-026]|uniref:Major facilitator superfamily (MFS) profile domain-containing protein n=1 Tax=Rhizopogon vinicolor AM-OR11-026 TaxID=1314800 RepID=A0A1B7MEV5_9AGAM|nr:hypothetical protein K503DRAFT_870757 [Rhizopogon vinicolor AM-OR11-026]
MLTASKGGLAYFIFGGFALLALLSATFLYPETKGRSLEEMDAAFGDNSTDRQREHMESICRELVRNHFGFRNLAPPTGAAPHPAHGGKIIIGPHARTQQKLEPKRPAVSKDLKQKAKADSSRIKGDIQMKDESARPRGNISMKDESVKVPRVTAIKRLHEDASPSPSTSTTTSSKGAFRRLPGAGYVAKSPQLSPAVEAAPYKAVGSVDARPQKPLPRNTLSTKPAPALLPPPASQKKTSAVAMSMNMMKKALPAEDSNRDPDRPPKDRVITGVKHESAPKDEDDTQDEEKSKVNSFKKRKMEDGPSPATSSPLLKARGLSLPKKSVGVISPSPKNIKKESSPLPPPRPALPTQPPPSNSFSKTEQ